MTTFVLPFEKMHGLGNDFVFIEKRNLPPNVDIQKLAISLCNRHFGIGADGLILVDFSNSSDVDFKWDYINSDGSFSEMCGNGMRCFAKYVYEHGFTDKTTFSVMTLGGIIIPTIESDSSITVDLGKPLMPTSSEMLSEVILVDSREIKFTYIEVGNPHCVIFSNNEISDIDFLRLGPLIEKHVRFPKSTNVEFVKIVSKDYLKCRVWERGCGPTLACGTGAAASLLAAYANGFTDSKAQVSLPGGVLNVSWDDRSSHVYINGPASFVYSGVYNFNLKDFNSSHEGLYKC